MKLLYQVRRCLIVGATLGLLMPQATFAGELSRVSPIRDVALQQGGTLRGEILLTNGQSAAGQTITLAADGEVVAEAVVGTSGEFVIGGLRPGVYAVTAGKSRSVARLWSATAAPPVAKSKLLLVEQQSQTVRGQLGGHLPQWDHPFLVSGLLLSAGVIGGIIGYNIKDFDPAS